MQHPTGRFEARLYHGKERYRYYLGILKSSKRTDHVYFPMPGKRMRIPALSYRQDKDKG